MKTPRFLKRSEVLRDAFSFLVDAYGEAGEAHRAKLEHSIAAAELLAREEFDDELVAAGLLHDVVEDTSIGLDEVCRRFGQRICELVGEVTEDGTIERYEYRKAEHRARVAQDRRAAVIYAADKLAKVRQVRRTGTLVPRPKLRHYAETLRTLRQAYPDLPFLDELEPEL
jgi:(p)ppGpp synthase/HD superfamily hydrolase